MRYLVCILDVRIRICPEVFGELGGGWSEYLAQKAPEHLCFMRIPGMISAGWEAGKSSLYYLYKSPDPPYLETISKQDTNPKNIQLFPP